MKEIEIHIPGYRIQGQAFGREHQPMILALHGWLDNSNSFYPLAQQLAKQFYVLALDLPGHGHSSHLPEGMNYHFIDSIYILDHVISQLKPVSYNLIGHSMGACMASLATPFLEHTPDALILIEGLGPLSHPADKTATQLNQYGHKIKHISQVPKKQMTDLDQAATARSKKGHVSFEIAKLLCERGTYLDDNNHYYWRHDPRLLIGSPLRMTEEQVLDCLALINCPTLLIHADQGFDFGQKLMQQRIVMVKNIEVKHLSGGHHIHMEQPELTASVIQKFINHIN